LPSLIEPPLPNSSFFYERLCCIPNLLFSDHRRLRGTPRRGVLRGLDMVFITSPGIRPLRCVPFWHVAFQVRRRPPESAKAIVPQFSTPPRSRGSTFPLTQANFILFFHPLRERGSPLCFFPPISPSTEPRRERGELIGRLFRCSYRRMARRKVFDAPLSFVPTPRVPALALSQAGLDCFWRPFLHLLFLASCPYTCDL